MKRYQNLSLFILGILVTIGIILFITNQIVIEQNFGELIGQNLTIKGMVVENDHGCDVDGYCILHVVSEGKKFYVIYHKGWGTCENMEASNLAYSLKKDDKIEIYGEVENSNTITVCNSEDTYIIRLT